MTLKLDDYFRDVFTPAKLAHVGDKNRRKYAVAVRRLGEYLGREPMVSDLTEENASAIAAWMIEHGRTREHARVYWKCLRAIGCFAFEAGLPAGQFPSPHGPYAMTFTSSKPAAAEKPCDLKRGVRSEDVQRLVQAAVLHASGKPLDQVARQLDIPVRTLWRWRREQRESWDLAASEIKRRQVFAVHFLTCKKKGGAE